MSAFFPGGDSTKAVPFVWKRSAPVLAGDPRRTLEVFAKGSFPGLSNLENFQANVEFLSVEILPVG